MREDHALDGDMEDKNIAYVAYILETTSYKHS